MSLENEVKSLREAVTTLTEVIRNLQGNSAPAAAPVAPAPQAAPQPAPAPQAAPAPVPQAAPAPAMPAPPSFAATAAAPAPAPAQGGAPFTDHKGLIEYVMARYQALGAEKGAMIQQVLVNMGYQNINDVKPEHYGNLYAGIEALK